MGLGGKRMHAGRSSGWEREQARTSDVHHMSPRLRRLKGDLVCANPPFHLRRIERCQVQRVAWLGVVGAQSTLCCSCSVAKRVTDLRGESRSFHINIIVALACKRASRNAFNSIFSWRRDLLWALIGVSTAHTDLRAKNDVLASGKATLLL